MIRYGPLALPAPVAAEDEAAGDPLLDVLGDFLVAVLRADVAATWKRVCPNASLGVVNGPTNAGRGHFTFDPRKGKLLDPRLPSLFLFREDQTPEQLTLDIRKTQTKVVAWWVLPRSKDLHDARRRDAVSNAVIKAFDRALYDARHAAWVVPGDLAKPEALAVAFATSTSAVTLSGSALTGALAGTTLRDPRAVILRTAPAPGAYAVGQDIQVVGTGANGRPFTAVVQLTDPDGGEDVSTIWHLTDVHAVKLPAMTSTAGRIAVGYDASPEAALGSILPRVADVMLLRAHRGVQKTVPFLIRDHDTGRVTDTRTFEVVEVVILVDEQLTGVQAARAALHTDLTTDDGSNLVAGDN